MKLEEAIAELASRQRDDHLEIDIEAMRNLLQNLRSAWENIQPAPALLEHQLALQMAGGWF